MASDSDRPADTDLLSGTRHDRAASDCRRRGVRRALVTGGSGTLGAAICRRLAADGLHVIVHAHTGIAAADAVVAAIRAAGGSAETWTCDLTDIAGTEAALRARAGGRRSAGPDPQRRYP